MSSIKLIIGVLFANSPFSGVNRVRVRRLYEVLFAVFALIFVALSFGGYPSMTYASEMDREADNLLLFADDEKSAGQTLRVDVHFLSPAWRIKRQGKGLPLVGMSKSVVASLHQLDQAKEYRCQVTDATFQPRGIRLESLGECRSLWKNN